MKEIQKMQADLLGNVWMICLQKYNIKYFLTSKTLKSKESYKDWSRIAHVVLAEELV